jgi:hypothetical protein
LQTAGIHAYCFIVSLESVFGFPVNNTSGAASVDAIRYPSKLSQTCSSICFEGYLMSKTTLVIGAGVSREYGFPTGAQLIDLIKNDKHILRFYKKVPEILDSGYPSIDLFLHEHKQFSDGIKGRIAKIIFEKENIEKLNSNHESLYFHLFNNINPNDYEKYKIITFNYDRSLEYYFFRYLHLKLGNAQKALEIGSKLEIIHIHGRVVKSIYEMATPVSGDKINMDLADFGGYTSYLKSHSKAQTQPQLVEDLLIERIEPFGRSSFKTIHENNDVNKRAKEVLEDSDRIFFLGFQYAKENMNALGFDFIRGYPDKKIYGTCYGMGKIEQNRVTKSYSAIKGLIPVKAYDFFQEYVCIDDATLDNLN